MDLVKEGKYDPSFVFTNVGKCALQVNAQAAVAVKLTAVFVSDIFENVPREYDMQFNHAVPGGLKSIMVTPYGRELDQPL